MSPTLLSSPARSVGTCCPKPSPPLPPASILPPLDKGSDALAKTAVSPVIENDTDAVAASRSDSAADTHLDPSVSADAQKDISADERHSSQLEVRTENVTVPVSDKSTAGLAPPTTTSTAATPDEG